MWTIERLEMLAKMVAAGDSSREIAVALSVTACQRVTRTAVIGKVYRLGLRRPPQIRKPPRRVVKAIAAAAAANFATNGVTLTRLKEQPLLSPDSKCQWLHGDAQERNFCDKPTVAGFSWCPEHRAVVFVRC